MNELKCKNCGAPLREELGRLTCPYCGSVYEHNSMGMVCFELEHPKVHKISADMMIDWHLREYYKKEELSARAIRTLASGLAEGLAEYMKVDVREDPRTMATIIKGTVRVVPPDFRF